jgi:hypothetical protein
LGKSFSKLQTFVSGNAGHNADFNKHLGTILDNCITKITDSNKKLIGEVEKAMLLIASHDMIGRRFLIHRLTAGKPAPKTIKGRLELIAILIQL